MGNEHRAVLDGQDHGNPALDHDAVGLEPVGVRLDGDALNRVRPRRRQLLPGRVSLSPLCSLKPRESRSGTPADACVRPSQVDGQSSAGAGHTNPGLPPPGDCDVSCRVTRDR
jgi:hypothetical protein